MALGKIAFLLLLDYSGSMDQQIDGKPKIEMMQSAVNKLLASPAPDKVSRAVVFGSRPEKGCDDLQISSGSSEKLSKYLGSVRPGAFGKTPLTKGLEYVFDRAEKEDFDNIVAVTDGADSCKQDPCEVLKKRDKNLKQLGKKIELLIIGLDLKSDRGRFSCWKDTTLSAIEITLVEARSERDIEDAMLEMRNRSLERKRLDLGDEKLPVEFKRSNSSKTTESSLSDGGEDISPTKSLSSRKQAIRLTKHNDPSSCGLVVTGASAEARFEIEGIGNDRKWFGQMPIELNRGKFFLGQTGQLIRVELECKGGEVFKIPWATLLDQPQVDLKMIQNLVHIRLEPTPATELIHGDLLSKELKANLSAKPQSISLGFGSYLVNVDSPLWFKGKIKPKTIELSHSKSEAINVIEMFKEEIKVVENAYSYRSCVMRLTYPDGQVERHLIFKGQVMIPVPKLAKVEFIIP